MQLAATPAYHRFRRVSDDFGRCGFSTSTSVRIAAALQTTVARLVGEDDRAKTIGIVDEATFAVRLNTRLLPPNLL